MVYSAVEITIVHVYFFDSAAVSSRTLYCMYDTGYHNIIYSTVYCCAAVLHIQSPCYSTTMIQYTQYSRVTLYILQ